MSKELRIGEQRSMKIVNMTCKNCDHSTESHHAGKGQCYSCPAEQRCPEFEPKSEHAAKVHKRDKP